MLFYAHGWHLYASEQLKVLAQANQRQLPFAELFIEIVGNG